MGKEMMLQLAQELKQQIIKRCPKTEKIILYGSYARGDNTEESDMDIMIVVSDSRENVYRYRDMISDIESDLSLKYDITLIGQYIEKETVKEQSNIARRCGTTGAGLNSLPFV